MLLSRIISLFFDKAQPMCWGWYWFSTSEAKSGPFPWYSLPLGDPEENLMEAPWAELVLGWLLAQGVAVPHSSAPQPLLSWGCAALQPCMAWLRLLLGQALSLSHRGMAWPGLALSFPIPISIPGPTDISDGLAWGCGAGSALWGPALPTPWGSPCCSLLPALGEPVTPWYLNCQWWNKTPIFSFCKRHLWRI